MGVVWNICFIYRQIVLFRNRLFAFENKFSKQYKVYYHKVYGNYAKC